MTRVVHPSISARPEAPRKAGFGRITGQHRPAPAPPGAPDFTAIRASAEFITLRRRFRRFVFPLSALFFCWYLTYVVLAAYAHAFMSHRLFGSVTVGLVLGLLQFVSTVAITAGYVRYARRRLDPQVALIRAQAGVER